MINCLPLSLCWGSGSIRRSFGMAIPKSVGDHPFGQTGSKHHLYLFQCHILWGLGGVSACLFCCATRYFRVEPHKLSISIEGMSEKWATTGLEEYPSLLIWAGDCTLEMIHSGYWLLCMCSKYLENCSWRRFPQCKFLPGYLWPRDLVCSLPFLAIFANNDEGPHLDAAFL